MSETSPYYHCVREVLQTTLGATPHLKDRVLEPQTAVFGTSSALLDSLGLVTFIIALEEEIQRRWARSVRFSPADILKTDSNPFASLADLSRFVQAQTEER